MQRRDTVDAGSWIAVAGARDRERAVGRAARSWARPAETTDIERWGFSIHAALSAAGREFHNHDHVVDSLSDGDPLEVIAALYHDAVYIQVDQGPPRSMRDELDRVLAQSDDGWRVLPAPARPACRARCSRVFGRQVGDVVTPTTGLNEFASALVASLQLEHALDRKQRIAVAACIEQTIPFREDPVTELRKRLAALGLAGDALEETRRARGARRQPRRRELRRQRSGARSSTTPGSCSRRATPRCTRRSSTRCAITAIALQKMEQFLAWLPAERVFHAWGDEPRPRGPRAARRAHDRQPPARRALPAREALLDRARRGDRGGDRRRRAARLLHGRAQGGARPEMKRIEQFLPTLARRARSRSAAAPAALRRPRVASRASTPSRRRSARSCTRPSARPR